MTKVLQFVFSNEYFAENTKKRKCVTWTRRVTAFNRTEIEQSGNGGIQPVVQNQQLASPPPSFSVQPAQDDMRMGNNNDGAGFAEV